MKEQLDKVWKLIRKIKERQSILDETTTPNVNDGSEIIVGSYPFDEVQNIIVNYIIKSKAFINGNKPNIGTFKRSYGYGKVIGIESLDGKIQTRIDFNPNKGYHYHFEDYRKNKPVNYCILINDMTEKTYETYIDLLTKRYPHFIKQDENIKEDSIEILFYKNNQDNIELVKMIKKICNYSFLNNLNSFDIFRLDPFELICFVEYMILEYNVSPKYRIFLDEYLQIANMYSTIDNFINYLSFYKKYLSISDEEIFIAHHYESSNYSKKK